MKKLLAILMVCIMALSTTAFAADFVDMPNDWSTSALENAVANGLLAGSDGKIAPNDNLTRAQMATIMVRAFGATAEADISGFKDVTSNDWFYPYVSKAVAMGAFNGAAESFNPNNSITRQEAFVVLSRVFGLAINEKVDVAVLDSFSDANAVADWAKTDVAAIIASGYVGGSNGMLNPGANITRAEFAVVMDRLVKYYIDEDATTIPSDGNVMIRKAGLKVEGFDTEKMVVIGDGVDDGEISIANSHLDKVLVVRAGKKVAIDGRYAHVKILRPGIRVEGSIRLPGESYEAEKVHKVYIWENSTFSSFSSMGEAKPEKETEIPVDKVEEIEEEIPADEVDDSEEK